MLVKKVEELSPRDLWDAVVVLTASAIGGSMANPRFQPTDLTQDFIRNTAQSSANVLMEVADVLGVKQKEGS